MRRNTTLIVIVVFVLLASLVTGLAACGKNVDPVKKKTPEEIALENAYTKQYVAIIENDGVREFIEVSPPQKYIPRENLNSNGILVSTYIYLACYHKETGKTVSYQQVMDYLSQKYESDGTIRIYNNGRHPEIAEYVEWAYSHQAATSLYYGELYHLYADYGRANPDFIVIEEGHWSTATIDELIKKEADPNYQMNLLAIQQQEAAKSSPSATP